MRGEGITGRTGTSVFRHSCFTTLIIFAAGPARLPAANTGGAVFLSDARLGELRRRVAKTIEPNYAAFLRVRRTARAALERKPRPPDKWHVPGYYRDADGHRKAKQSLQDDANGAYACALVGTVVTDPAAASQYRTAAARYIDAWTGGVGAFSKKDDSMLSFSYHFTPLVLAADLVRRAGNDWPRDRQAAFDDFLRNKALPMNTANRKNNWGNWGLSMSIAIASYLGDERLFADCVTRWKYFIEHQVSPDGHLHHEVKRNGGRSGLWYSNFSLLPQTIACEIANLRGTDLYDYRSPSGRSLRRAFDRIAPWIAHPQSFPYWKGDPEKLSGADYIGYFELLNVRWPNKTAAVLIEKNRPVRIRHGAPYLTFTHGDLGPEK